MTKPSSFLKMWNRYDWLTALILGLMSGTFFTIIVSLGAGKIGRSASVDWMELGTVYLGWEVITEEPTVYAITAGLITHQSADLAWALVFFGLLAPWTRNLSPLAILLLSVPWAILTAAIEYWGILPWKQPLVPMQVPYWTALTVHLSSGLMYPAFHWIRSRITGDSKLFAPFSRNWALALIAGLALLGTSFVMEQNGLEPAWPFVTEEAQKSDQQFLRLMTAHHEVGLEMSRLAAEHAEEPELRMLGRLMAANHLFEINMMRNWWQNWYDSEMPGITSKEREAMKGMPTIKDLHELTTLRGKLFDQLFIQLMVQHHEGAIMMARETWGSRGDPRIQFFAYSIIHAQVRQIELMERYCTCNKNQRSSVAYRNTNGSSSQGLVP